MVNHQIRGSNKLDFHGSKNHENIMEKPYRGKNYATKQPIII